MVNIKSKNIITHGHSKQYICLKTKKTLKITHVKLSKHVFMLSKVIGIVCEGCS
jgi:hypothetical protein